MRGTGIIRRIDELGRIVLPKEIRRMMRLTEGDPMEILTDPAGGEVVLRKYRTEDTFLDAVKELKRRAADDEDLKIKAVLLEKLDDIETVLKAEPADKGDCL